MKICGHMMVKNEEFWVWYAITSVLDFVDELLVWDTGSTDKTIGIIKSIDSPKIKFRQIDARTPEQISAARRQMLAQTKSDWIFLVDGDEIWTGESLREISKFLRSPGPAKAGIHHYWNLLGDVFHFLPDSYGRYQIAGLIGNLSIRLFKNSPDLRLTGLYPLEAYLYGPTTIQSLPASQFHVFQNTYFHASFLPRTNVSGNLFQRKIRYQFGYQFPHDFAYPEVFYIPHPQTIRSAWQKPNLVYYLNATWQTPLKMAKNILPDTIMSTARPSN